MTPDMRVKLRKELIQSEGIKSTLYFDTQGIPTIGVGRNLRDRGLLSDEIDLCLNNDLDYFNDFLFTHYLWFRLLNEPRQIALINLCFAGTKTFTTFKRMIAALEKGDFDSAADEVLDSLYAKQVGNRAVRIADILRTGQL